MHKFEDPNALFLIYGFLKNPASKIYDTVMEGPFESFLECERYMSRLNHVWVIKKDGGLLFRMYESYDKKGAAVVVKLFMLLPALLNEFSNQKSAL